MMGKKAHVLVVPYPAQGHVTPLLKLSHRIADYGVKVTFVNTQFVHAKIMATMPDHNNEEEEEEQNQVRLVSIPDGLGPNDDRRDALKLLESIRRVMPGHLKDLIEKIGHTEKIRCVIADPTLGWILEVAKEMGIEQAAMWPAGTRGLPLFPHIPKLIESGVMDMNGWPFLWIVRRGLTNRSFAEYPDGFAEKVAGRGKIVEWAPQEKLLGQSAIACFMTHCGWNSTMEGVSNGVPFLCWPYFGDQFHNRSSICDVWKVGLRLEHDENKIVSRHEIKKKIENLLSDDDIKANSLKLKEIARTSIEKGGSSCKNLERFVQHLKQ